MLDAFHRSPFLVIPTMNPSTASRRPVRLLGCGFHIHQHAGRPSSAFTSTGALRSTLLDSGHLTGSRRLDLLRQLLEVIGVIWVRASPVSDESMRRCQSFTFAGSMVVMLMIAFSALDRRILARSASASSVQTL